MTPDSLSSLDEIADHTAELAQLRDSVDDILQGAWSVEKFRVLLDGPGPAFDPRLWRTVAELGWPDVLVSDAAGGGGGGLRELCVLAEAAGAVAAPIPLPAAAAAGWCADRSTDGISLLLPGRAELDSDGVSGLWPVAAYGAVATALLVCGGRGDQTVLGTVDPMGAGVIREPVRPLDHSPAARISLQNSPIEVMERGERAARRHHQATLRARVAQIAELVGIASAANETATAYAKLRTAFGRPIGSFQAVKHRLVDQRCAIEVGRALVNRAADAIQQDQDDADALAALAAFWAMEALRSVPEGAMQVFGGIAYTWEHHAHVHLRRAATIAAGVGARAHHREVVAAWLSARHASDDNGGRAE
ncbi:acyl-CoA dehydrogenase family protein [Mycobacterium vicinigordonae]|uniref:Acyl-CoA/acyl-ACP dehydrogenase n=1 Tax=Mycobacterium vicinigordonae TaxID=1719132 RepID=A0A7D6E7E7_9MYCO|nr:acyl-CoA dehydrogenase family protein [Mycobacterium vicinigordonae]QLL08902.1 acyl-CoA/acyl-ACP dehydrogenase [Mycobacterium vicinigordonae]